MKNTTTRTMRARSIAGLFFSSACLLASCVSAPAPDPAEKPPAPASAAPSAPAPAAAPATAAVALAPQRAVFEAADLDPASFAVPYAVGKAADSSGAAARLAVLFQGAYRDALLSGVPLKGVLGGDVVHPWTAKDGAGKQSVIAYSQNWRVEGGSPNSWGLPSLALAVVPAGGGRAFLVRGAILDAYGSGGGESGRNGPAGYGAPLCDEYPLAPGSFPDSPYAELLAKGGTAQRFEKGLILASPEGETAFAPGEPPSALRTADGVGQAAPGAAASAEAERASAAVLAAWRALEDSGGDSGELQGGLEKLGSVWVQRFSRGLFLLPGGDEFPYGGRARWVPEPFAAQFAALGGLERALSEYGAPIGEARVADGVLVQRFLKGSLRERR